MNIIEQCRLAVADEQQLDKALGAADAAPLLLSLVHLTGDAAWLDQAAPFIKGGWAFQQSIPEEMGSAIRNALRQVLVDVAAEKFVPQPASKELLTRMMNVSVGQTVPPEYDAVFYEETQIEGADPKRVEWRQPVSDAQRADYPVVIVGAGLSGIGMAIKLAEAGIPYTIIEKNPEVGGTWFENIYPGVAVDTPNHFYSYSFQPNPAWTRYFARGSEIQQYILECVKRYGIRDHIRFGEDVVIAEYAENQGLWKLETRNSAGQTSHLEARVFVSAVGALNKPSIPKIPGLESFEGPVFHTARWDKNVNLEGKRVALVGTGASGIQIAPAIAPIVQKLTILQRSPHWIISHPLYHTDVGPDVQSAMALIPYYMKWFRFQLFWAASDGFHPTLQMDPNWEHATISLNAANHKVREDLIAYYTSKVGHRPDLISKVIPSYPPFGKRMLRDTGWFDMLLRPNVDLVTEGVDRVERNAVVTSDSQRHEVDVIVLATGFQAARMLAPMKVVGKGGVSLQELWGEDDPRAYLGITLPGFPNFFMLYGPNTNLAHGGSAIYHSECQIRYSMQGIRELVEKGASSMECRAEPFEAYNVKVDEALRKMVWSHPGVTSWYKNKKGRVIMNSPWRLADYRHMTARLEPGDYSFTKREKP